MDGMHTKNFKVSLILSLILFLAAFGLTTSETFAQSKKGAVLGFAVDLSGPGSLYGQAALQAAQLALEEVNNSGGVLGGQLDLRVVDDGTDPNMAHQVWENLVNQGVDAIMSRETSAARVAALPVAEKANVPVLYANDYEGGDCSPVMYTTGEIEPQKIPGYLSFLMEKSGGKKFFILATDYNWARIVFPIGKNILMESGAEVVGEEYTPFATTDYTPLITKIRQSGADVIFAGLVGGPDNVAFFKQAQGAGLLRQVLVGNLALDDSTLSAVGGAAEGSYMAASYFDTLDTPENKAFKAALKAKFGDKTMAQGYLSVRTYDTVHLYARAINKAGTTETGAVLKALSEVSFDGPGGKVAPTTDRHTALPIYISKATKDGTYEVVQSLGIQIPPDQCDPDPTFGMPK